MGYERILKQTLSSQGNSIIIAKWESAEPDSYFFQVQTCVLQFNLIY